MSIPTGWRTARLGEECSIEIGGTPSRNIPDYWDDAKETTNLWVSIKDLTRRNITTTAEQITDAGVAHSNVKLQPPGTVLLSFKLTIGRVAAAGMPLYTNEAIAGLRSKTIVHDYLYYGLQQWDLLQGVDQAIKGATLNKAKLKKIEFNVPSSKCEQAKISEILSAVDCAIQHTEALIAKQRRIKTGLVQHLLTCGIDEHGTVRSEQTHAFKDSPLGRIPADWDVAPLHSVAAFVTSGSRGWARYYSIDGPLFLRIGNLTRDHINLRFDDVVRVSPPTSAEGQRTAVLPRDLLISITADLGIVAVAPDDLGPAFVNQHIALTRLLPDRANPRFVGWFLSSRGGQAQFERLNESGAKAGLNLPTVERLLVPTMEASEQARIAQVLDATTQHASQEFRRLQKLRSLKAGLMQDLLTGRNRVTSLLEADSALVAQVS